MPRYVIYTNAPADVIMARLAQIPAMCAGTLADPLGISRGLKLRVAVAFLELVKLAFLVKARGGTDEAGIKWPPLTKEYLAYGRGPFSTRRAGKQAPGKVRGGPRDGQQNDGFLSPAQMKTWRGIYAGNLKWLSARHPMEEAKSHAAAIAWARLKEMGAKTKLDVFGNRVVDILRDRGTLFNSLSPGVLTEMGPDAAYSPPYAQIVKIDEPGAMLVGSNVKTASIHQNGTRADHSEKGRGAIRRQLWPEPAQIPAAWQARFARTATRGLVAAVQLIARAG